LFHTKFVPKAPGLYDLLQRRPHRTQRIVPREDIYILFSLPARQTTLELQSTITFKNLNHFCTTPAMIRKMVCQCCTTNCPATQALKALGETLPAPEALKRARMICNNTEQKPSLKRQRCALDLSDMVLHIKPVEESIAFPTIEWSYDDEETPFLDTVKGRSNSFDLFSSTASNKERISSHDHSCRSSSARLGGKRARGESLVRSSAKGVCLVSLLSHTISSDALNADCMSACLNAQKLPVFSLGNNSSESPPTYGATANESVCLALSQLVA
jgi:hypothetical protein